MDGVAPRGGPRHARARSLFGRAAHRNADVQGEAGRRRHSVIGAVVPCAAARLQAPQDRAVRPFVALAMAD